MSAAVFARKFVTLLRVLGLTFRQIPLVIYIWVIERNIPRQMENLQQNFHIYAANIHSQVGQDGIIQELFNRLDIKEGTFCEFGAWDGMHLSNTRKLISENWSGVYIEGDPKRFEKLVENYPNSNIVKINAWVGFNKSQGNNDTNLQDLLRQHVSQDYIDNLDLLIIDVDGLDLEIAMSSGVRAKLIVIEGGSSFVPSINHPFPNASENFQHPLKYILSQLHSIGYIPLCFRQDLFLVREDLLLAVLPDSNILTAEQLFAQNFYLLPRAERRWQLLRRQSSSILKEFEIAHTNNFHPNPLRFIK